MQVVQAPSSRTEKLDLRLSSEDKQFLRKAATAVRRSVSEFVLDSALSRAAEMMADRQNFVLDAEQSKLFIQALDAEPREMPRLLKLFHEKSRFEIGW